MVDPLAFIYHLWPHVTLYAKQEEIVRSVWENDETYVPAGNMLGAWPLPLVPAIWLGYKREGQLEKTTLPA